MLPMTLLLIGFFCGICALGAALVTQFRLPLWTTLTGIAHLETEQRTKVRVESLRQLVSLVYYVLALALLTLTLALYLHLLSETTMKRIVFGLLFLALNSLYIIRRRCDHNAYLESRRRLRRLMMLVLNFLLAVLVMVSILTMV